MNRKSILLLILAVLIIVLVIQLAMKNNNPANESSGVDDVSKEEVEKETKTNVAKTATPTTVKKTQVTATPDPKRVYEEALVTYANRRIQFDAGCQANPRSMTINNGTSIMFDNRSGDARWISLDETGYNIAGYGYKIIPVSASTLPYTVRINCGSAVNVGSILLQ